MRQTLAGARAWPLSLLPLLAPALRTAGGARTPPGLPEISKT
jgi:hypothetical protein